MGYIFNLWTKWHKKGGDFMIGTTKVDLQKITLERANQGLSAYELSLKAGLSKNVVSNMERGYVVPRLHTIGKIVNALGKKLEDFIEN